MAASIANTYTDIPPIELHNSSYHPIPPPFNNHGSHHCSASIYGGTLSSLREQRYLPSHKSPSLKRRAPSMPMSTGSQSSLLASLPSFASVFGDGSDSQRIQPVGDLPSTQTSSRTTIVQSLSNNGTNTVKRPNSAHHFSSPGLRRDSASTFESVNSSPTTTISTVESSLTEPSPSSSPESPTSMLASSPLKAQRTNSIPLTLNAMELRDQFSSSYPTLPGVQGSESPNKKMRNTKNLSVNTTASNRPASQLAKVSLPSNSSTHASSAPPTPAFIVPPPKGPRRKPSNLGLSITTPESTTLSGQERPVLIPQTPSDPQIRTLRALPTVSNGSLFSPTHAPEGGMRLPPVNNGSIATRFGPTSRPPLSISPHSSFDTTTSSPIKKQTLDHVQEERDYELPLSQEVKSPAYPQGPVCIYEPYVYLYMEPTDIEAAEFDVVINVAREVKNPFSAISHQLTEDATAPTQTSTPNESQTGQLAGRDHHSETYNAAPESYLNSSVEGLEAHATRTASSTPKASRPRPEYIHIPWDHNTNVVDDLLRLCELIEERVRYQKRVLVHCQCGVSRSASLVVAYGLYKNPHLTVQEAYDAVKSRSRWIGPNMNLIYQLSEFKTKLGKTSVGAHGWVHRRAKSPQDPVAPEPDHNNIRTIQQKSLSAPSQLERTASFDSTGSQQVKAEPTGGDITPGPLSAPPGIEWSPKTQSSNLATGPESWSQSRVWTSSGEDDNVSSLRSSKAGADAFQPSNTPPAGAVGRDLQSVANGLSSKSHYIGAPAMTTADKGIQVPAVIPPPPGEAEWDDHNQSTTKQLIPNSSISAPSLNLHPLRPQPSLPAGFSSLLSRRQNPQTLPIRQESSRLTEQENTYSLSPLFYNDNPPTPSLMSPRAAEFTASPFHRTSAGDLAGSSLFEQGLMSPRTVQEDPRSPHQVGEAPITRNIFDMLAFDMTPM